MQERSLKWDNFRNKRKIAIDRYISIIRKKIFIKNILSLV
jgi:hypothetical protein